MSSGKTGEPLVIDAAALGPGRLGISIVELGILLMVDWGKELSIVNTGDRPIELTSAKDVKAVVREVPR